MHKDTQMEIIEQDLERGINEYQEIIERLQAKIRTLEQLKQDPVIFEIAQKYQIPVEDAIAIIQDLKQANTINPVPNVCIVHTGTSPLPNAADDSLHSNGYNKGLTEAILTILKQNPDKDFTAAEMADILPKNFNRGSIHTAMSELCRFKKILVRENFKAPGHWSSYKYHLKRKPNKEKRGVLREKLISFLKDKKQFWHTSRSIANETGLNYNYVSSTASVLFRKGLLEREIIGYAKLRHGATSVIPTYKFKLK